MADVLASMAARGVRVTVAGDRLRVDAPPGVVTPELQQALRDNKAQIIALLRGADVDTPIPPRADRDVPAPLSAVQERIWLFQQLEPGSATYNLTPVVRLRGRLDVARLERALHDVVKCHEPLRTHVVSAATGPTTIVGSAPQVALPVEDVSGLAEPQRLAAVTEAIARSQREPFDLATQFPWRAILVRHAVDVHDLVVTLHHIAADGTSIQILFRELFERYAGRPIATPPIGYSDFAEWQRRALEEGQRDRLVAEWKAYLEGVPTELALPTDRPRPPLQTFRGGLVTRALSRSASAALLGLLRGEGATLFTALLTAFAAALHRQSGQRDLLLGAIVDGRTRQELRDLVGMFVDQLPLRARVTRGASLRALLRSTSSSVRTAFSQQGLPFPALLAAIGPPRDRSRTPLFQAVVNLLPTLPPETSAEAGGVRFSAPDAAVLSTLFDGQSKFDVSLYAREGDEIQLSLVYNADLYNEDRVRSLLGDVERVLIEGAARPDDPVDALLAAPVRTLEIGGRRVAGHEPVGRGETVPERFARHARAAGSQTALHDSTGTQSYADLLEETQRIARLIVEASPEPGRAVGVFAAHDNSAVRAILGVLTAGRPYVPLDPRYPRDRLRFMAEDAEVSLVLTSPSLREAALAVFGDSAQVLAANASPRADTAQPMSSLPEATAYLLYTSGSTGQPKAVRQTQRNLVVQADRYAQALSLTPSDRVCLTASISFDGSLMDLFGGLLNGATVCPVDLRSMDFGTFRALVEQRGITTLHMTPSVFRTLARGMNGECFHSVRVLDLGGEAVRAEDVALFERCFSPAAKLMITFGASEHSFAIGYEVPRALHEVTQEIPIGWPLGDTDVVLLSEDGAPDAVEGELALVSAYGALEYWRRPELTARAFRVDAERPERRMYRTGDVVRRRSDGAYLFLRRVDQQLKIRGHRVEPNEIEAQLQSHPAIAEAAVHATHGPDGNAILTACVVPKAHEHATASTLAEWCRPRLPDYMIPSAWVIVASLPRTPSGKVDRRALPQPIAGPTTTAHEAPQTQIEQLVADAYAEVLGLSAVSRDASFFDLGGHSLLAAQVVTRLNAQLRMQLPLRALFDGPTPAQLAPHVEQARRDGRGDALPRVARRGVGNERTKLSSAQERLWFLEQLAPETAAYHLAGALELEGELDVERLRGTLHAIAVRHESLRTHFEVDDGTPVQVIDTTPCADVEIVNVDSAEGADSLRPLLAAAVAKPFDLRRGSLLRAVLYRLTAQRHVLLVVTHHLVSDAWSMGVFVRELCRLYGDASADPTQLEPLPVQYADYAIWQRALLDAGRFAPQVDFWRATLEGAAPSLELPADRPRPSMPSLRGGRYTCVFPLELQEELAALSRREGVTLFMTLLAGFQVLLFRLSGQADFVVGTPVANRPQLELEGLIGLFVNTLLLRARLDERQTVRALLEATRDTCLGAYANQDLPFEKLVEALRPQRDPSRNPLFQVTFVLQNAALPRVSLPGLTVAPVDFERASAQVDLTVQMRETPQGLVCTLEYATDLFDERTVARMAGQFGQLLCAVAAAPDTEIAALPLLRAEERAELLHSSSAVVTDEVRGTVVDLFTAQANRSPQQVAVSCGADRLTYAEIAGRSLRFARRLRDAGVAPGSLVAVCVERGVDLVPVLLGILEAGAAYVPLDPDFPEERLRYMLEDCGAPLLVTSAACAERFAGNPAERLIVDSQLFGVGPAERLRPSAGLNDRAYVIYTSGSTGRPKGVEIEHGALTNFLNSMRDQPGLAPSDVLLAVTTVSFDIAALELFLPLVVGARVEIAPREIAIDGVALAAALAGCSATAMQATPATWRMLLDAGWQGRRELKALCGGEALTPELAARLLPACGELWNLYGPTETTIWSSAARIRSPDRVSIGTPIANTTMYVLDARREPVPIGVVGELWIGGAGVARGYLGRPELTAERFVNNPFGLGRMYRTGDFARRCADGTLQCLGRVDEQVKIRGYRIELGEIESALAEHALVRECAVVARLVGDEQRLIAHVVGEVEPQTLREHLRKKLPDYMLPAAFVRASVLPRTPNRKIDRKALPLPEVFETASNAPYVAPQTPTQILVSRLFAEVLSLERVGARDDFFQLGGHSLLIAKAAGRLRAELGIALPLRVFFDSPTVETLSEHIDTMIWSNRSKAASAPVKKTDRVRVTL